MKEVIPQHLNLFTFIGITNDLVDIYEQKKFEI